MQRNDRVQITVTEMYVYPWIGTQDYGVIFAIIFGCIFSIKDITRIAIQ